MNTISVILPAYNAEKTIESAVRSILVQSYKYIELIVVDDGSEDNTGNILEQIKSEDSRIQVLHIPNGGVSNARNLGIKNCSGDYIAFVDADDIMAPHMLERLAKEMEENVDLVCCGYRIIDDQDKRKFDIRLTQKKWAPEEMYKGIEFLQKNKSFNVLWNKLFRRSIVISNFLQMDGYVKMGEDLLFVVAYISSMNNSLSCIPDALYSYRLMKNGAQALLNKNISLSYRLDQLYRLKPLYVSKRWPLDSIYEEHLRCIYLSACIEKSLFSLSTDVFQDSRFVELTKKYEPSDLKNRLFLFILRTKCKALFFVLIRLFSVQKRLRQKSFSWH